MVPCSGLPLASRETSATGYPGLQLDAWAKRALQWGQGEAPADLPYAGARGVARTRTTWFKDWLIQLVVRKFNVDMAEAAFAETTDTQE